LLPRFVDWTPDLKRLAFSETLGVAKKSVREYIVKGRGEILPLLYDNDTSRRQILLPRRRRRS
jgi:hypothetical protein